LESFTSRLKAILENKLPGREAQFRMAPYRKPVDFNFKFPEHARKSSVMVSYFFKSGSPCFILMKRSEYKGVHSGQICFPGGAEEPEDQSSKHTAIREVQEEIGVCFAIDQIIGKLSPLYIPVSNFIVQPFMAFLETKPKYALDPLEVDNIIEVDLEDIMDNRNEEIRTIKHSQGFELETPCFVFNKKVVWGASAMIIAELKQIINNLLSPKESGR
jgi:8-oxo-dGTP pyrophosphatase MutT (NUDIX family)